MARTDLASALTIDYHTSVCFYGHPRWYNTAGTCWQTAINSTTHYLHNISDNNCPFFQHVQMTACYL